MEMIDIFLSFYEEVTFLLITEVLEGDLGELSEISEGVVGVLWKEGD